MNALVVLVREIVFLVRCELLRREFLLEQLELEIQILRTVRT